MKPNKFILSTCAVALLVLTACGGGSSGTAVNVVVMYKSLAYDEVELQHLPKSYAEALSIARAALTQRGIYMTKEVCGDWKELHTGSGVEHFITVAETQADSVKSIGYEKYTDKGEFNFRSCD